MKQSIPGQMLLSVDLPKVAHAVTFGRNGTFHVKTDGQRLRLGLASAPNRAELVADYNVLSAILTDIATSLREQGPAEPSERVRLKEAATKVVDALEQT